MSNNNSNSSTPTSNNNEETTAAASIDDAAVAHRLRLTEQLVSVLGFPPSVVEHAMEALPDNTNMTVETLTQYILEHDLAKDPGGPITPRDVCEHVQNGALSSASVWNASHLCAPCSGPPVEEEEDSKPSAVGRNSTGAASQVATKSSNGRTLSICGSTAENWLCLHCGVIRCSRYQHGHCADHFRETNHSVCASLSDLSVWCHCCQSYLNTTGGMTGTILRPIAQRLEALKFGEDDDTNGAPPPKRIKSDMDLVAQDPDEEETNDTDNDNDDEQEEEQVELSGPELLEFLAAQGIPIELLLAAQQEGGFMNDDQEEIEYPFVSLPTNLQEIADFILSDRCNNILVLAGAGMSVNSGIPDFRSANGLYATLDADQLTATAEQREDIRRDPTTALDQHLFLENPLPCLELKRSFILGTHRRQWKATLAHRFLEVLHNKTGKLIRTYTQNIDGLECQLDLPSSMVVPVHGSMDRAECARCEQSFDFDTFCQKVQTQIKDVTGQDATAPQESTPISCPMCGSTAVKPAIVLFRSSLPKVFFEKVPTDIQNIDLLLILGTSLRVAPANSIVWRVPRSCLRVLINREPAGQHLGMDMDPETALRDYHAAGDIDETVLELMEHLGWLDDLAPLLERDELPESSAKLLRERLSRKVSASEDNGTAVSASADDVDGKASATSDNASPSHILR